MIRAYFREHGIWYLLYAVLVVSFLAQFLLYGLLLDYFLWPLGLATSLLLAASLWLFSRFYGKMLTLQTKALDQLGEWDLPSERAWAELLKEQEERTKSRQQDLKVREKQLQATVKLWSHQMKVPLAALSLMAQTDQLEPTQVNHQLHHLDKYLGNLLNYLKLKDQQLDFRFEVVDARSIMTQLIKDYRTQFLQKNLTVTITGDYQLPSDKKWLAFALSQILDNALKYSHPGGQITIDLTDGIAISDQGMGILPEDLPRLGQEGFTGYNGHLHQKATGFGLYMTKNILDQLELEMTISSQLDEGTTVRVVKK